MVPTVAAVQGLALGGGSVTCAVSCNHLLLIPVSLALLRGRLLYGALLLVLFCVGYVMPLAALLLGFEFGFAQLPERWHRFGRGLKYTAGIALTAAGFYLLFSA